MQGDAASTAARDDGSGVGASGVGGVSDNGVCGAGGRGVCGGIAGGRRRYSSTTSAMVVESKLDVEMSTAPFWFPLASRAATCCSAAFGPLLASCYLRWLPRAAGSSSSAFHAGGCGVAGVTRWRSSVGASGVGGVSDGGDGVDGICSARSAGGVCGIGSAGYFTRGVCGDVSGGPSRSSSIISAMVVESKLDVELPTAPFWLAVRLSCSLVLFDGRRPSPSFLLPTVLGCLAPLAPVAAPLTREAAASTAARDGGSGVGASGGVDDGGRRQRRRRRRRVGFSFAVCCSRWHIPLPLRRVRFSFAVCYSEWHTPPFLACCPAVARRVLLRRCASLHISSSISGVLPYCGASDSPSQMCLAAHLLYFWRAAPLWRVGFSFADVPRCTSLFLACCATVARRFLLRRCASLHIFSISGVLRHCGASVSPSQMCLAAHLLTCAGVLPRCGASEGLPRAAG